MSLLRQLFAGLRALFQKKSAEQELSDELSGYLDSAVQEKMKSGLSHAAALRAARLEMGSLDGVKESVRAAGWENFIETLWQDLRFAARMLRKSPGFTAVAVLTLALGIGANTAIFSLVDAVMLRTLPIRDPQHLLFLKWTALHEPNTTSSYSWGGCPGESNDTGAHTPGNCTFSYPMFEQIRSLGDLFSGVSAFAGAQQMHVTANGWVSMATDYLVSGDFFTMLGTRAVIGRTLDVMDDEPGASAAVLLSYGYWQRRFGSDPSIVGKSILLENTPFTVVGVAAPGFTGLDPGLPVDIWAPLASQARIAPNLPKRTAAKSLWIEIAARLKPGVSALRAESALEVLFATATTSGPGAIFKPNDAPRIELISAARGLASLRQEFSQPLSVLMACVGIVLLIVCANVGGLSLSRATLRRPEIAMRFALGASRGRIVRQLLTESLLISAIGAALGIFLAYWSARALAAFFAANWFMPVNLEVRPDGFVLAFATAVAVLAGMLFGLAPALQGMRVDLAPALKGTSRRTPAILLERRFGFGSLLVIAQVALSVVVLAGAGLLVYTLVNLRFMNVGFETGHVLLFSVDMDMLGYSVFNDPRVVPLDRELQTRLAALPGVSSASYSMVPLLSGANMTSDFKLPEAPPSSASSADELPVGTGFFETMRIPLLVGRTFTATDFQSLTKPQPIIVNESFARRLFGIQNPLGRAISEGDSKDVMGQIVGVVGDARYNSLLEQIAPTVYTLETASGAAFELRTQANPKSLIPLVRSAVSQVNGNLLISDIMTQTEQIDKLLYQQRLVASLSALFGALALLLDCIGLYGLLSYEVNRRTHEIGIRMALGAQQRGVFRLFVRKGLLLTLGGALIGLAVTAGITRFLQSLLYGVRPIDPYTFVGAVALLALVASAACYIPARRAMRTDPMVALRYE